MSAATNAPVVNATAPTTVCAAFEATVSERPDAVALRTVGGGIELTWAMYAARVRVIAAGLAALGVGRGDAVALMLTNRPEFHLVDTAVQHLGGIPFSVYNTSSPGQIAQLLARSGARIAITEQAFVARLSAATGAPYQAKLDHVVLIDGSCHDPAEITLAAVEKAGDPYFDLISAGQAVRPDDVLTLVFTSGTTGEPKGVEITHTNMAALAGTAPALGMRAGDRLISFLPSAHIADRWASHYLHTWCGTEVTCLPDRQDLLAALLDVRPTIFGAVPQVWQRLVNAVRAVVDAHPDSTRRQQVRDAIDVGVRHVRAVQAGSVPTELAAAHRAADVDALATIRERLGLDQVRIAITSAAPAARETVEYVNALGIPLADAWGMSELSGMVTMNPPGAARMGTVGKPSPGVQTRLAADGELLVRGPMVMRGYRDQPEETAATIDADGWLHTGDVATIDPDGYLSIVDRKKELIITTGGKNIAPSGVERAITAHCPLAGQVAVIGDGRPYLVALIVLDLDAGRALATEFGIDPEPAAMAADERVRAVVAAGIDVANQTLSRAEQVKAFDLLPEVWQPGGDLVTHTMKLRRRQIQTAYATRVDALYAASWQDAGTTPRLG